MQFPSRYPINEKVFFACNTRGAFTTSHKVSEESMLLSCDVENNPEEEPFLSFSINSSLLASAVVAKK